MTGNSGHHDTPLSSTARTTGITINLRSHTRFPNLFRARRHVRENPAPRPSRAPSRRAGTFGTGTAPPNQERPRQIRNGRAGTGTVAPEQEGRRRNRNGGAGTRTAAPEQE